MYKNNNVDLHFYRRRRSFICRESFSAGTHVHFAVVTYTPVLGKEVKWDSEITTTWLTSGKGNVFSCNQAALQMVFSVCLSVCPSVRLSHLFDYVPIIVSSWNFQKLSPRTRVRSMQKVKVRGQRSRSQRSQPNFPFPDCNSSLNSHMMMKWYI